MKNIFSAFLFYLFLKPLSWLPLFVLHLISSFTRFVVFDLLKYRREVVMKNLRNSFPDRSEDELQLVRKRFESHFGDLIVESIKNFSISKKKAELRLQSENEEIIHQYLMEGRNVAIAGGHQNNWELYGVGCPLHLKVPAMAIYKKLNNHFFDKKMRDSRGKFGLEMVPTKEASAWMKAPTENPKVVVYGTDQSPANPKKSFWMNWLNQETAMYFGLERHAKQYDMVVVFGSLLKVKRGYYKVVYHLVTDQPNQMKEGDIIKKTSHLLEKDIKEHPQYWLWTHKIWKHKRPEGVVLN
ncbi:MAG: lysophospholipid acyltransferase family protein [Bacteroidota bacterium]